MFEALKGTKIYDWNNFKNYLQEKDPEEEEEVEPLDYKLKGLAYV